MEHFTKPAKIFQILLAIFFLTGGIAFISGGTMPWQQPLGSLFNSLLWSAFLVFMIVYFSTSELVRKNFQSLGTVRTVLNVIFVALLIGLFAFAAWGGVPIK